MWNVALLLIRYTRRHNVASTSATFDIMSRDIRHNVTRHCGRRNYRNYNWNYPFLVFFTMAETSLFSLIYYVTMAESTFTSFHHFPGSGIESFDCCQVSHWCSSNHLLLWKHFRAILFWISPLIIHYFVLSFSVILYAFPCSRLKAGRSDLSSPSLPHHSLELNW